MTLLLGYPLPELPYLKIPLHTVIKLTLVDTELIVEYNRLPVDCVDTYRSHIFQFGIALNRKGNLSSHRYTDKKENLIFLIFNRNFRWDQVQSHI
jgi:hypothetical protein